MQIEINKEEPKKSNKKKGGDFFSKLLRFLIVIIILGLIGIFIKKSLVGTTTTKGQSPSDITTESLVCSSPHLHYSMFEPIVEPTSTSYKLTLIFSDDKTIRSIFLDFAMNYENVQDATKTETFAHADMNRALAEFGFEPSKFDKRFSINGNVCSLTLFAEKGDINETTIKFFGLNNEKKDEDSDDDKDKTKEEKETKVETEPFVMPTTITDYKKAYINQGFSCSTKN